MSKKSSWLEDLPAEISAFGETTSENSPILYYAFKAPIIMPCWLVNTVKGNRIIFSASSFESHLCFERFDTCVMSGGCV